MVVVPLSDSSASVRDAASAPPRALPLEGKTTRAPATAYAVRMVAAAVLTAVAFATMYSELLTDALSGSRAAYVVALPVLLAVGAVGYRSTPRGVDDVESDWIVTALIGISGFVAIYLVNNRMPTLAGFWGVPLLGLPLWLACLVAVLFGLRHAVHMWPLWVFAICCATPLPYLLTVAMFGGSDTAAALVVVALGAVAVYLGGRLAPTRRRLGVTLGYVLASTAFIVSRGPVSPEATIVIVGAAAPVGACLALHVRSRTAVAHPRPGDHRHSPVSLVAFAVLSAVLFALHPTTPRDAAVTTAQPDWTQRAQLGEPQSFDFITRFLGSGATLTRYPVAPAAGLPAAAVDVMSAPTEAALADYSDAVWYPSSRPLDYRPADLSGLTFRPDGAEVMHTDIATATDGASQNWYAVTWAWRADDTYQRVTVLVNQDLPSDHQPPPPAPLTVMNSVVEPALWIARQKATTEHPVDPQVILRAADVANRVLAAAGLDSDDAGASTSA